MQTAANEARAKLASTIMNIIKQGLTMDEVKRIFQAYADIKQLRHKQD